MLPYQLFRIGCGDSEGCCRFIFAHFYPNLVTFTFFSLLTTKNLQNHFFIWKSNFSFNFSKILVITTIPTMLWILTLENDSLKTRIHSHDFNFWSNNQCGFYYTQMEFLYLSRLLKKLEFCNFNIKNLFLAKADFFVKTINEKFLN
jgi:hypothetical protein